MKILIADDEPTMRTVLRAGLTQLGYQVEVASSGADAWDLLQQQPGPEIAILDWNMPEMTGLEICRKLRERKNVPYVYAILLSGNDRLNDLVAGLDAGADDYMIKPFRPAELNARLRAGRRVLELQSELLATQRQLSVLASHDALTGLWNRRTILEKLGQELARSKREKRPLGLIMLGIDHFKRINDTLGHSQGDEVLQQVALRLSAAVRPYDSVGHYGGEEFLILAANCNMAEASIVGERARNALYSSAVQASSGPIAVSASFGVSSTTGDGQVDAKALINAAERALSRAKELGRNRVEGFLPEPGQQIELR